MTQMRIDDITVGEACEMAGIDPRSFGIEQSA